MKKSTIMGIAYILIIMALVGMLVLGHYVGKNQVKCDCWDCKWKYQRYIDYWIEKETQYRCLDLLDCIRNESLQGCSKIDCNVCCNGICSLMACGWEKTTFDGMDIILDENIAGWYIKGVKEEPSKEKLLGADISTKDGDKTCKVYGYIKKGKAIITKVELEEKL